MDERRMEIKTERRRQDLAPQDEYFELNIGNILQGKFPERFEKAFQQVIENMRDVNTPADAKRKVAFVFTLQPSEDRASATVVLDTKLTLASLEHVAGTIYVSRAEGTLKAYTRDIRQEILFDPTAENGHKQ